MISNGHSSSARNGAITLRIATLSIALLGLSCVRTSSRTGSDTLTTMPSLGVSPIPSKDELDRLIQERQDRNLAALQKHPYHQGKSLAALQAMAMVGKKTQAKFVKEILTLAPHLKGDAKTTNQVYQEYQRIWYLADEGYSPLRVKKWNPDRRLIPYLRDSLDASFAKLLLPIFRSELEQESKDPRALGNECSELLKLRAIVDTMSVAG